MIHLFQITNELGKYVSRYKICRTLCSSIQMKKELF